MNLRRYLGSAMPIAVTFVAAALGTHASSWSDLVLARLFPAENTYGGVAVPLHAVRSAAQPQPAKGAESSASLLMIQQSNHKVAKVDIFAAGLTGGEHFAAGASSDPPPHIVPLTDTAAGSSRIMEIDLPRQTLLTVVVDDPPQGNPREPAKRFTYQDGDTWKQFSGDLEIRTRSEEVGEWVVAAIVALTGLGFGYATGRRDISYPPGPPQAAATPSPAEADGD